MNVTAGRFGAIACQNTAQIPFLECLEVRPSSLMWSDYTESFSATLPDPPFKKVGFVFRLVLA